MIETMQLDDSEQILAHQVGRLIEVQTQMRWAFVLFLWLTLGSFCIWWLRQDIALWFEFFTWSAVRISLQHNRLVFLGLGLCVGMTLSTLIWQSWHILWGIRKSEYRFLIRQVLEIQQAGSSHPLWEKVCEARIKD
jgi:hypothetical protein